MKGGGLDIVRDRDKWKAVVKAVMNLRVPQNAGNSVTISVTYHLLKKHSSFIQSVSLRRFVSSFSLSMTGTSAHLNFHPRTDHEGPAVEQRYSTTLSLTSALDGVGVQRHAPAALPSGKTQYPLYGRLTGPQDRSGGVREISPPPPRRNSIPGPLYPLRYPGPLSAHLLKQIYKECPFNKAVSRWLPTADSRVQYKIRPSEICSGWRNQETTFLSTTVFHCHYNYTSVL
jgi:hypothetical protein